MDAEEALQRALTLTRTLTRSRRTLRRRSNPSPNPNSKPNPDPEQADAEEELPLDVLDDFLSEADEVYQAGRRLTPTPTPTLTLFHEQLPLGAMLCDLGLWLGSDPG